MATKDSFTGDEWEVIRKSPFMAGLFVANASPSGVVGTAKEMFAVGKVLAKATTESAAPLLKELATALGIPGSRP